MDRIFADFDIPTGPVKPMHAINNGPAAHHAFAAAGIAWEIRPDRVTPEQFALIAENLA